MVCESYNQFNSIFLTNHIEKFEIKKDSILAFSLARFYALTGDYDKMVDNFKYLREKKAEHSLMLTYYIGRKEFDKARKFIDEVPKDMRSRSFIAQAVAVLLELGEVETATDFINTLDVANKSILQAHFGRKDRFLTIVNILESNPNIRKTSNYHRYKEIVEKYLDEHGITDEVDEKSEDVTENEEASGVTEGEETTEENKE